MNEDSRSTAPAKRFLPELSRKYGAKVYTFNNPRFPFYVEGLTDSEYGDEEGCTEDEIKGLVDYNTHDGIRPWAAQILGWHGSVLETPDRKDEIHGIMEEIDLYLETMFGLKAMNEYPEWLQEYLHEEDDLVDVSDPSVWFNVVGKVLPHLT